MATSFLLEVGLNFRHFSRLALARVLATKATKLACPLWLASSVAFQLTEQEPMPLFPWQDRIRLQALDSSR